ncbi:hypothetical protein [Streptomyces sp. NPDC087859]
MKRNSLDILEGLAVARHRRTPRSVPDRLLADDWSEERELARSRTENDD